MRVNVIVRLSCIYGVWCVVIASYLLPHLFILCTSTIDLPFMLRFIHFSEWKTMSSTCALVVCVCSTRIAKTDNNNYDSIWTWRMHVWPSTLHGISMHTHTMYLHTITRKAHMRECDESARNHRARRCMWFVVHATCVYYDNVHRV